MNVIKSIYNCFGRNSVINKVAIITASIATLYLLGVIILNIIIFLS